MGGQTIATAIGDGRINVKKVAILTNSGSDYSQGCTDSFVAQANKDGTQIVLQEKYPKDTKDFGSYITKVKQSGADAVYIPDYYEMIATMVGQFKNAGYEGTLKHITSKAIKQISSLIDIKNLKISFGPSASYFSLKNEDVNRLEEYEKDCIIDNDNCLYLDIRKANLSQLLTNNIKKEQIDFTNMFDTLKSDFTFSASKDKIQNRMISLIMLKQ